MTKLQVKRPTGLSRKLLQTLAWHRHKPGADLVLDLEEFRREPALMCRVVKYVQQFDTRVHCLVPFERFPHMPRVDAARLARSWPEVAKRVQARREGELALHLELFDPDPELLWLVTWYAVSRRMPVLIPRPSQADRYYLLPPPMRKVSVSNSVIQIAR